MSYERAERTRPACYVDQALRGARGRKNQVHNRRKGEGKVKVLRRIWDIISYPFIALSVLRDEERRASIEDEAAKKKH